MEKMITILIILALLFGIGAILLLSVEINKNLLKKNKMIKGYIIKKIGEDIYFGVQFISDEDENWTWVEIPQIYETKQQALEIVKNLNRTYPSLQLEVKRADIFITP